MLLLCRLNVFQPPHLILQLTSAAAKSGLCLELRLVLQHAQLVLCWLNAFQLPHGILQLTPAAAPDKVFCR